MGKSIPATKGILQGMRVWGKPSNQNHSDKIRAVVFFFVNGKDKNCVERINEGDIIKNVQADPLPGLLVDFFPDLAQTRYQFARESPLVEILEDSVEFFQIYEKDEEKDGVIKRRFWLKIQGPYSGDGVQAMMTDVANNEMKKIEDPDAGEVKDPQNLKDYESLAFYDGNPKIPVSYLLTIIKIVRKESNDVNDKNPKTVKKVLWHIMGLDHSRCVENYMLMQEFGILPFDADLGKVEELGV
jgi:hypothetical protein